MAGPTALSYRPDLLAVIRRDALGLAWHGMAWNGTACRATEYSISILLGERRRSSWDTWHSACLPAGQPVSLVSIQFRSLPPYDGRAGAVVPSPYHWACSCVCACRVGREMRADTESDRIGSRGEISPRQFVVAWSVVMSWAEYVTSGEQAFCKVLDSAAPCNATRHGSLCLRSEVPSQLSGLSPVGDLHATRENYFGAAKTSSRITSHRIGAIQSCETTKPPTRENRTERNTLFAANYQQPRGYIDHASHRIADARVTVVLQIVSYPDLE